MTDVQPQKTTVSITVDGKPIEARPGELIISAAQREGIYIPRFCYHERMSPVGMCRMCLVEVEGPRGPSLMVSCMVTVTPNMVVRTDTPAVKKAQDGVLEFLLINHPLDCPVCDKGGECPLQDQTLAYGPGESRFVEEKRHYEKPIPISGLVMLDRERCILCDRCTRFAKEVAGDPLIHFTQRGNQTQVLTFPDEPFSSYFSGNTVQICPVGALTSSTYRFKARPWDLEEVESTCTGCSVGCRITVESSRNHVLRYNGVDVDPVNWGWLCDKGRFSFQSIESSARLAAPLVRKSGQLVEASWSEALDAAATAIRHAVERFGPGGVAVLGGARGTNEDAYAWAKLAKAVIGTDHVDAQLADGLPAEVVLALSGGTIDQVAAATTIVTLTPDLKEELPVLFLRVRDALEKRTARLVELAPRSTGLSSLAWRSERYAPGEAADAVARLLADADVAAQLAKGNVAVVVGRPSLAESEASVVAAIAALRAALPDAVFLPVLRRGNVHGAIDMGLAPGVLPGRVPLAEAGAPLLERWRNLPPERGLDAAGILGACAEGRIGCLVLLGADPLADVPDRDLARRALEGATAVVAVDTFLTVSSATAAVVLPAAGFAEKSGSTSNLEGRVSRLAQKVTPPGTARSDWLIAVELAHHLGFDLGLESPEQIWDEIRAVAPSHADVRPSRDGELPAPASGFSLPATTAPEVPRTDGYGLRLVVSRKLYDGAVATVTSPSLAALAPGAALHLNPYDVARLGVTEGANVRVSTPRASVTLPVRRDDGVPRGLAWSAFNQPDVHVGDLLSLSSAVVDVRVETL